MHILETENVTQGDEKIIKKKNKKKQDDELNEITNKFLN